MLSFVAGREYGLFSAQQMNQGKEIIYRTGINKMQTIMKEVIIFFCDAL